MIIHSDYPFPVRRMFFEDEMEVAYVDVGNADTVLVFIHGFASYAPVWARNISLLKKYYRCVALDLPGHGLSTSGDYPYTIDFYKSVIVDWMRRIDLDKKVVLIGHSMGGQISIRLALDHPELFSHLILVAPAGFEVFSDTDKFLLQQFTASGIIGTSQYLKWVLNLKNYFYQLNEQEYEKLREFTRDFYSQRDHPNLNKVLSRSIKGMTEAPVFDELSDIALPTLVFYGNNDKLIPNRMLHPGTTEEVAQKGCERIPDCRLVLYKKCGHFLQYEYAARFNIDLYKFLNPKIFG